MFFKRHSRKHPSSSGPKMPPLPHSAKEEALRLLQEFVKYPSISPDSTRLLEWIASYLSTQNPSLHIELFETEGVWNLLALPEGLKAVPLAFCGHTDVVPTGSETLWQTPPFQLHKDPQGRLTGRGVADMKGALAAILAAYATSKATQGEAPPLAFLITGDEEGLAKYGTRAIVDRLKALDISLKSCVVGEPTSDEVVGDCLRNGRRGSINARMIIQGKTEHVAYATPESNVAHQAAKLMERLSSHAFEDGFEGFPNSSLQLTQVKGGSDVTNITPASVELAFNLRFSPKRNYTQMKSLLQGLIQENLSFPSQLEIRLSAAPYQSKSGWLTQTLSKLLKERGVQPKFDCGGGTSDGRFVAEVCEEIVEIGLGRATIHQANESTTQTELNDLTEIYYHLLLSLKTSVS